MKSLPLLLLFLAVCAVSSGQSISSDAPTKAKKLMLRGGPLTLVLDIHKQPTCDDPCGGEIHADIDGGENPYTYQWSNGGTDDEIENLCPGVYSVTVTDDDGATISGTVVLEAEDGPSLNVNVMQPGCSQTLGSIDITAVNAEPPVTFLWSNGATTEDLINVPAGTYTVTLTDFHGCSAVASAEVVPSQNLLLEILVSPPDCNQSNGAIEVSAFVATPPLSFVWSTGATTSTVSNLPAGTYSFTVTDGAGCTADEDVTIEPLNGPTACFNVLNNPCACSAPHTVQLESCSQPAGVTYQWSIPGAINVPAQSSVSVTFSTTGVFDVSLTVTDASGCSATVTSNNLVQIGGPSAAFGVPASAMVGQQITLQGSSATSYQWGILPANVTFVSGSDASQSPVVAFTQPGSYSVCLTVTGNASCPECSTVFACSTLVVLPTGIELLTSGIAVSAQLGGITVETDLRGTLQIVDLLGRVVQTVSITEHRTFVADLPKTLLLYRFATDAGVFVGKVY